MSPRILSRVAIAAAISVSVIAVTQHRSSATTPVTFGALSNFDVFNDTGEVTHGFEIDLEGISASDIVYKFGAPYERYGDPTVQTTTTGVKVIYASPYDSVAKAFTAGTPLAPNPITPTAGHACWTGGSSNYPTAGCEHFGLSLTATPTNVSYSWLIADPAHAGQLIPAAGGVPLPAPILSTSPAPVPAVNPQPVVHVVAPAPEPDLGEQLGNAVWVKVWVMQSTKASDLGRLQSGDAEVPSAASQVEDSWALIQAGSGGGFPVDWAKQVQMQLGKISMVRKFEFYKYTGAYDPSSHEALASGDAPAAGELGSLIGVQMVALNLAKNGVLPGDHTAPVVHYTKVPALVTTLRSATFAYAATDKDSPLFTWYCKLDRAIPSKCLATKTYLGLKPGKHTMRVYASDPSRNASKAATWTWTIK